jgi:exodeoxyribonuclease V alpha subunit
MNKASFKIQIETVYPGVIGGAVFKGLVVGERKKITFRTKRQAIVRTPRVGEFWEVHGRWETYKSKNKFKKKEDKTQQQILVSKARLINLPVADYVGKLLQKHPRFRGFYFGDKKIKLLLREIGAEALVALLNDKNHIPIADVLHEDIAKKIIHAWGFLKDEINTIQFLEEHDFGPALSRKVISLAKANTVERLKNNPYSLVCFNSITRNLWTALDSCAEKLDIPKDDLRRLQGAVETILYQQLQNGHTAYPLLDVMFLAKEKLGDDSLIKPAINAALANKAICVYEDKSTAVKYLQLIGPAYIEINLAKNISSLLDGNAGEGQQELFKFSEQDTLEYVKRYNEEQFLEEHDYSMTDEQIAAVVMALTNKFSGIAGFAGTGKTTVLKAVVKIAEIMNRPIYGMALSGKAKMRLENVTKHKSTTIHGFIKLAKSTNDARDILPDALIIIDEVSMVDVALYYKLIFALRHSNFSIVNVGDAAQISPVGFGLVWHRLIKSRMPLSELTIVQRTAAESPLHAAAMQIRQGQVPEIEDWTGQTEGIYFINTPPLASTIQQTVLSTIFRAPGIQVISPHVSSNMTDSAYEINFFLQANIDSRRLTEPKGIRIGNHWLTEGSPVIITENSYDLDLYNGMTGELVSLDAVNGEMAGTFHFDHDDTSSFVVLNTQSMYELAIQLAYCISIHKSQGSEYDSALIICAVDSEMIERSLMYTAITRCKKLCLIAGSKEIFEKVCAKPNRSDTLHVGFHL